MSVNRKVTTPQGLGAISSSCHGSPNAQPNSACRKRHRATCEKPAFIIPEVLVDGVLQLVGMRLGFRRLDVRQRLDSLQRDLFDLFGLDVALQFVGLLLGRDCRAGMPAAASAGRSAWRTRRATSFCSAMYSLDSVMPECVRIDAGDDRRRVRDGGIPSTFANMPAAAMGAATMATRPRDAVVFISSSPV